MLPGDVTYDFGYKLVDRDSSSGAIKREGQEKVPFSTNNLTECVY